MIRLLCLFVCFLAIQTGRSAAAGPFSGDDEPGKKVWKVLMIGNSYTYFNNLPRMFEQVTLAGHPPRRVSCEMVVEGGATLKSHWEVGKAQKAIERGGWDFVVLQEQSTLGMTYLVQGQSRIIESPKYRTYAHRFDAAIRKAGARTVLLAFWARENAPPEDHGALAYYHFRLGKELGSLIAPVGLAWRSLRKCDPRIALYQDDHSHPRPEGTYLAACVLYATCFGAAPADPPVRITGHRIDDEGKAVRKGEATLIEVSPETARTFRDAANEALAAEKSFVRDLHKLKPAPPELPKLGRGQRPTPEDLEGEWAGETKVYPKAPNKPATMTLHLTRDGGSWQAKAKITFGGKPDDIVCKITEFQVAEEGISFTDANTVPNGGGVARYRAVFTGKAMRGIAEIDIPEASLHVIGSWELTKKK